MLSVFVAAGVDRQVDQTIEVLLGIIRVETDYQVLFHSDALALTLCEGHVLILEDRRAVGNRYCPGGEAVATLGAAAEHGEEHDKRRASCGLAPADMLHDVSLVDMRERVEQDLAPYAYLDAAGFEQSPENSYRLAR